MRLNEETPKGARVVVLLDNGQEDITRTRSKPWWLITARRRRAGGQSETKKLVVLVEGIIGCYAAERVRVISQLDLFAGK